MMQKSTHFVETNVRFFANSCLSKDNSLQMKKLSQLDSCSFADANLKKQNEKPHEQNILKKSRNQKIF